jgi:hypothetical protein
MHCRERDEYVANATDVQIEQRAIRRSAQSLFRSYPKMPVGLVSPVKATVTPPK